MEVRMQIRLFLLEDDAALTDGLSYSLRRQGYLLETAGTISEAKEKLQNRQYDLLLLDVTLPDGTGFAVCDWLRARANHVPIIFLTALDDEVNMVRGLDMGADDYITKPFKLSVLIARIHAVLRRSSGDAEVQTELNSAGVKMSLLQGKVSLGERTVELTNAEYRLLRCFMEHPGQVLSADQLLERLWDCDGHFVDNNTLSVYISRLRTKIEEIPAKPRRIMTVRGMGYKWNAEADA